MKSNVLTGIFVVALACAAIATFLVGYQAVSGAAPDVDTSDNVAAIEGTHTLDWWEA